MDDARLRRPNRQVIKACAVVLPGRSLGSSMSFLPVIWWHRDRSGWIERWYGWEGVCAFGIPQTENLKGFVDTHLVLGGSILSWICIGGIFGTIRCLECSGSRSHGSADSSHTVRFGVLLDWCLHFARGYPPTFNVSMNLERGVGALQN